MKWIGILGLMGGFFVGSSTLARERSAERSEMRRPFQQLSRHMTPSWTRKTLGGRILWSDVHHVHGWRIQKNVVTGHHRLLDPHNVRHTWGSFDDCEKRLEASIPARDRWAVSPRTVIVVHGLGNWSACLRRHSETLREAGYTVVPFDYPSNFVRIEEAADNLARVVASLPPTERVDFVGHSMGGIVLRSFLARYHDPRFGRAVLLGSPNNGAKIAHMLRHSVLFDLTAGPGGRQLAGGRGSFLESLAAPPIEFALIAGGRKTLGYNPFLRGDDDGLVRVESVRLPGAADFARVSANHHALLYDEEIRQMTLRFLQHGHLRESGLREPIPARN